MSMIPEMIIDVQTHLVQPCRMVPQGASPEELLAAMDAAGVNRAVIISYEGKDILPDTKGDPTALGETSVEDYCQARQDHPDRFVWFIDSIDPRDEGYLARAERDLARGATGIKMFPAYVETLPNDPRYGRLYDLCRERRLPIILAFEHWNDPNWGACTRDYRKFLATFEPVAEAYGDVRFLLTHWGCFSWGEQTAAHAEPPFPLLPAFVELLKRHDNLLTDIAAHQFIFKPETSRALLQQLVGRLGAHRVLYATDWPWGGTSPEQMAQDVAFVRDADFLDDEQKAAILGRNACDFLSLAGGP